MGRRTLVQIDIESPRFLDQLANLQPAELSRLEATLERIAEMTWEEVYKALGLKWEKIPRPNPDGGPAYSLRVSRKIRAVAYRDGNFMRFVSLHPDHDSAYR